MTAARERLEEYRRRLKYTRGFTSTFVDQFHSKTTSDDCGVFENYEHKPTQDSRTFTELIGDVD